MSTIKDLARKTVQALTPYLSARRIGGKGEVWLNANEAPNCGEFKIYSEMLNRYPEFQPPRLINAYALYASTPSIDIDTAQLLATRGADESIEILIRTFCEANQDSILICPPTYGMYAISAETCDVAIDEVALDDEFNVDYKAVEKAVLDENSRVKLVFLCAPNNPTGNLLDRTKLITLLNATKGKALIVVDEAYIEFCADQTQVDLINTFDNLVITRTLSKAFALAAIRCGFTIASKGVIEMMSKVIAPYPMPSPVAQIATQALSKAGLMAMNYRVNTLNTNREDLKSEIENLDCVTEVFPTTGNFLLVRFKDSSLAFKAFASDGIVMRDFANKPRLENCIRITIGSKAEMQATINTLKSL